MPRRTRLTSEEVNYVCAQHNLRKARDKLRRLKISQASEEEIEVAKNLVSKRKEDFDKTSEVLARLGISKSSI